MTEAVRRARPGDAEVVGRLLFDFNTEFESPTPDAGFFADQFRELLGRDGVLVLLSGPTGDETGFAFLTLRPTPYYDTRRFYERHGFVEAGTDYRMLLYTREF